MAHIEKGEGEVFFEMIFQVPVGEVKDENDTESDPRDTESFSFFRRWTTEKRMKIEEDDLKRGRR